MKKKKKHSRVRQKQSLLVSSGLPILPENWHDNLPELLYVIGAIRISSVGEVVSLFKRFIRQMPSFTGRVSELGLHLETEPGRANALEGELKSLFVGVNASLLRRFSVPGGSVLRNHLALPDSDEETDYVELAKAVAEAYEPHSRLATLAKLVQLLLIQPDLKGIHSISLEQFDPVLSTKDAPMPDMIAGQIRAAWLALQVRIERFGEWSARFWQEALSQTPCCKPPDRDSPDTMRLDEELTAIVVEMDRIFHALIDLEMKHALPSIGEVTFGLMCRIWRLAHEICDLSASGKGEVTEIVARCHFESAVTLLWLLEKHDAGLFQRFKDYAGGVDKRHLEYVRKMSEGTPELRAATEDLLAHDIRQAGMNQLLVAEEKGAWIDVSVREMAEGMDSLYMGVFARTSDIVHGSWRALTRYHLVRCLNPLHAYHWIPNTGPSHDAGLSPIICALLLAADSLAAVAKEVGAGLLWEDAKRLAVSARKAILSRFLPKGMNPAITEEG